MSGAYTTEPLSKGKVVLHTTLGDIDIELWPREVPKAVRNFAQLCLEGYYDGTSFHRVVRNFLIQGGDRSGTGDGGESVYGEFFPAEQHSRLRFARRGLVACAGHGSRGNSSQFFITLATAEQLQGKHTIFGRVTGDTIYNVIKANDVLMSAENDEVPDTPILIKSTQVIAAPFDDLAPRPSPPWRLAEQAAAAATTGKIEAARAGGTTRNPTLLSFDDDDDDDEDDGEGRDGSGKRSKVTPAVAAAAARKVKSAHALLAGKDPSLVNQPVDVVAAVAGAGDSDTQPAARADDAAPVDWKSGHPDTPVGEERAASTAQLDARKSEKRKAAADGAALLAQRRAKYQRRSRRGDDASTLQRLSAFQARLAAPDHAPAPLQFDAVRYKEQARLRDDSQDLEVYDPLAKDGALLPGNKSSTRNGKQRSHR